MSPRFRTGGTDRPASESPERLFEDLPRTRDGVPSLWSHQADMLREYVDQHLETADVALELPTGAGKTLPALLIAEWRRSARSERVLYACPTVQLAHQVRAEADRHSIPAVTLVGSHKLWDVADSARYERSDAVGICTYSTIFNSNPAPSPPGLLVFDDAHSADQFVGSAWSVSVDRRSEPDLYNLLLEAVGNELSGLQVQRLQSPSPDPYTRRDVRMVSIAGMRRRAERIDRVLSAVDDPRIKFSYSMVRDAVDRCLLFVGWEGFLLRPYLPPSSRHRHFAAATQRLYISATLGDGGELERSFGRAPISRLPVPPGWDQRGSGRRFFLFPELVRDVDARSLAKAVVDKAGKALVIAPSDRQLVRSKASLVPSGMPVFGVSDIETSLASFGSCARGVLALANRYDGMDFPDDQCRVTVLDGSPAGQDLQERFLVESLRAGRVLEERMRTRVIQGAGRSTRGLKDYSVVVVLGDDLTRFFQRSEVRRALRPEAQAEIDFGISNSEVEEAELRDFVGSFLVQDDEWQSQAEPAIADLRRSAVRVLPPGTDTLSDAAGIEVQAWDALWDGNFEAASQAAVEVAQVLASEGSLRAYRSWWLYLGASWLEAASDASGDPTQSVAAAALLRRAHAAAAGTSWLREVAPVPTAEEAADPIETVAAQHIAVDTWRTSSGARWSALALEIGEALTGTQAGPYENALSQLGRLLGTEAYKPSGIGRADSVWLFGEEWWVTLEAKSEALPTGLLSMDDVRQANTQLSSLVADRGRSAEPPGSVSIIVSPKTLVGPDAVDIAADHLRVTTPAAVLSVAQDAIEAWAEIRAGGGGLEGEAAEAFIIKRLRAHRVSPSHLRERLAEDHLAE